jgi:Raf kinase inhibitor-like YbhB/YbcL family protein
MRMRISSSAFEEGAMIPEQYSKEGGNKRPPLRFEDVPTNAKSLVMIVDDPDAPNGTFTHWLAFNISPSVREIGENMASVPMQEGRNDYGQTGYGGPKPPSGEHRYFFKLYALDDRLTLQRGVSRLELEEAMIGHVIAEAEFVGRYAAPELANH